MFSGAEGALDYTDYVEVENEQEKAMPAVDQLWGTFAVDDHLRKRAFVAETLLFDHLIVPVPALEEKQALTNWDNKLWNPKRVLETVEVLGNLVTPVSWDKALRDRYRERYGRSLLNEHAAFDIGNARQMSKDAFAKHATRILLADRASDEADEAYFRRIQSIDVDPAATVEIVAGYGSYGQLQVDAPLEMTGDFSAGAEGATLLFGWEFVVPEESGLSCRVLLERAVKLAERKDFIESRREFHEWRRKLIANHIGPEKARSEMLRCLTEFNAIVDKKRQRSRVLTALQVGAAAAPLADFAIPGLGAGSAVMLALGAFVFDKAVPEPRPGSRERIAALVHDSREAFGWPRTG